MINIDEKQVIDALVNTIQELIEIAKITNYPIKCQFDKSYNSERLCDKYIVIEENNYYYEESVLIKRPVDYINIKLDLSIKE